MKRILVIDDDAPIARMIGAALTAAEIEHTLDYCSDGAQGRMKASQGGYDLITLDLHMPLMSGVEALTEMKRNERSAQIPVVVISGQQDPLFHRKVLSLGAAAVVTKPFGPVELGNLLRQVLSGEPVEPPPTLDTEAGDAGLRSLGD